MKKIIRLTESDLQKIVTKSVNRVLKEDDNFNSSSDDLFAQYDEELNNDPRLMFSEMYDVFDDASEVLEILLKYASDDEIWQWCHYLMQEQDKLISGENDDNTSIVGKAYGISTK